MYKNFLRILEKWPLDTTKGERDLGLLVRKRIRLAFPHGETSEFNQVECEKTHAILKRLVDNHHLNQNKRTLTSSSTGLTAEQCKGILSTEFLKVVKEEEEKGLFSRLFDFRKK